MSLYFSGAAGYGFGIKYTPQVFTLLKDFYEKTSGNAWDWDYRETDMDFIGGTTSLFPGIYVQTLMFESKAPYLYVVENSTKVNIEKQDMVPTLIRTPTASHSSELLATLAKLFGAELGPVLYTDYS